MHEVSINVYDCSFYEELEKANGTQEIKDWFVEKLAGTFDIYAGYLNKALAKRSEEEMQEIVTHFKASLRKTFGEEVYNGRAKEARISYEVLRVVFLKQ